MKEKNVYDYFMARLGERSSDRSLLDLPLDSNCGEDCQRAIDCAYEFIRHINGALGRHEEYAAAIKLTDHIVQVYWRG
jgi:hypothetical protein